MFEPTNRFMLVDALRPPVDATLDTAVGTTFTLDLDALLLATLSFAVVDHLDGDDGRPDPLALLESVRRHADHITVFAQAGAMAGPKNHPPILAYLEDAVVPVRPARPGHLFHPKVWALKFRHADGRASYRLLVLSRNLTFDSSWDTIVRLDSSRSGNPRKRHEVVSDWLETLPGLAVNGLDDDRRLQLTNLADELRNVGWELPQGARSVWFWPLGPDFKSPDITGDRVMVMSPFLTGTAAERYGSGPGDDICISRPAAFDGVGAAALRGYAETFVVDSADEFVPAVTTPGEDDDGPETISDVELDEPRTGIELSGLHAKVWVTENGTHNRLWIGSANATGPAFDGNVEFLVECTFSPEDLSIDQVLDQGTPSLRSLLTPYTPATDEPAEPTPVEEATRRLDQLVRELATGRFTVAVEDNPDTEGWTLHLGWPELKDGQASLVNELGATLTVGPAPQAGLQVPWLDGGTTLPDVSLEGITSFLNVEARARVDGHDVVARTLVNAVLTGAPDDRKERLLASALDDPDKVLRYLLFLLAELTGDSTLLDLLGGPGDGAAFSWSGGDGAPPLLESLLRALAHAPESLDRVAEFVRDLRAGTAGDFLPPEFDEVWAPINAVREAQR